MEFGSIEREIHIESAPEVVFNVISSPAHMREWWNGVEADVEPNAGYVGEVAWGKGSADPHVEALTVVESQPPRLFSFRWVYPDRDVTGPSSLLVTFELAPSGTGTTLRVSETGFREMGWEVAVLEACYNDHVNGWDTFLPNLGEYAAKLAPSS